MTEVTIAMIIAWWVGVYHMMIGTYLIFISERRTPFLAVIGLVKGMLGAAIYLVVRQPLWVDTHAPTIPDLILPVTLLLMFVFSTLVTYLIWARFDLDPPQKRIRVLFRCAGNWWSRQHRRLKK